MSAPPRHHTPRNYDRATRGGQVAKLAAAARSPLLPWQVDAVDVALEVDPATGGNWYDTVVVVIQRQAGKTKLVGDVATYSAVTTRAARLWYTAQRGKFASSWMRDEYFELLATPGAQRLFGAPGSATCKYRLSRRAGQEGVFWPLTRSSFLAFPPLRDAMHSKQSDKVFIDEAWAHDAIKGEELRQAIRPTMNTRPGAQQWIVSAAGHAGSEYLAEYEDLGLLSLSDPTSRVCYIDYGIPEDADPEDLDVIAHWHPAFGERKGNGDVMLDMPRLQAARADFGTDSAGWARAYGTRRTGSKSAAFPPGTWSSCTRPRPSAPPTPTAAAIDSTPDGRLVAIAAAWPTGDDGATAELVWVGPPEDLSPILARFDAKHRLAFAYDASSPAILNIVEDIARDAPTIRTLPRAALDVATACNRLARQVIERKLVHYGQADLNAAVEAAARVDVGDGAFKWRRASSAGPIAPLVAVTLAVGQTSKPAKRRAVARAGSSTVR